MIRHLSPVIKVDDEKCINCHACISVCPVKFCNNGRGESVTIEPDLCIGCGACIAACSHGARNIVDDFQAFWRDLHLGEKVVAIVAPSVAANYPQTYLHLNGWLKHLGVDAIFDISFGAELAVKSYVHYIDKYRPETMIAQPCSSIVTFIEIYHPELLPYLIPVDSPMVHTIKMIRTFFPQYQYHRILVISPCVSKKRELDETQLGDYNVVFSTLEAFLQEKQINIKEYPAVDYDGPAAERAVLSPSPGGLSQTIKREAPMIAKRSRSISGVNTVYDYLSNLPKAMHEHCAPLLVDCLSCELGCNAGPGYVKQHLSVDEMEFFIERRKENHCNNYEKQKDAANGEDQLRQVLDLYWREDLYLRNYYDLSDNRRIRIPDEQERKVIYLQMNKQTDRDILNCAACGYGNCEGMAAAIYNGLNKAENCHFYRGIRLEIERKLAQDESEKARQLAQEAEAAHKEIVALMAVCQDIEERKRVEQELRERYEILDSILQNMPIMMDAYDYEGRIVIWNRECERVTGFSQEQILTADDAMEILYPDPKYRKRIVRERDLEDHAIRGYETLITCVDGSQREIAWFDVSREYPLPGWSRWAFGVDLTERKDMEARLDRLNAVGEMAASIAHEIRNPMTTIRGFLQLLYDSQDQLEANIEFFPIMIEELDRANAIITEYLSIASNKAIEMHLQNLNAIVTALYPIMSADATLRDKTIQLQLSEVPDIQGDQMEIRQLIINLVRNGLEAMEANGKLRIRTYSKPDQVILEVEDEGIGIPPQNMAQLYTPFFTTKKTGTGLGLSVCYSIVSRHNAQMNVHSVPGKTVFSIIFPTAADLPSVEN